ncbi:MAG: hypothetical protein MHMPM18_002674 [Marteilia pararefringens]
MTLYNDSNEKFIESIKGLWFEIESQAKKMAEKHISELLEYSENLKKNGEIDSYIQNVTSKAGEYDINQYIDTSEIDKRYQIEIENLEVLLEDMTKMVKLKRLDPSNFVKYDTHMPKNDDINIDYVDNYFNLNIDRQIG